MKIAAPVDSTKTGALSGGRATLIHCGRSAPVKLPAVGTPEKLQPGAVVSHSPNGYFCVSAVRVSSVSVTFSSAVMHVRQILGLVRGQTRPRRSSAG